MDAVSASWFKKNKTTLWLDRFVVLFSQKQNFQWRFPQSENLPVLAARIARLIAGG
jgi:hypothetical protein